MPSRAENKNKDLYTDGMEPAASALKWGQHSEDQKNQLREWSFPGQGTRICIYMEQET